MTRFIPREKLGKKARRELDARQRLTWSFSPVTRKVESRKKYNRQKTKHDLQMTESCFSFCSVIYCTVKQALVIALENRQLVCSCRKAIVK